MPSFLTALLLLFVVVAAYDPRNYFLNPPEGSKLVWRAGTTQTISWTTNATGGYNITLWQQSPIAASAASIAPIYVTNVQASGAQKFDWVVDYSGANLTYSSVFFLWANRGNTPVWSGAYFNITRAAVVTGGITSTISTSPSTSTPTFTVTGSSSGTTSSSPTNDVSASGNSNATAIGAGVGAGLGVAVLILAGSLVFFWRRRKQRKVSAHVTTVPSAPMESDPAPYNHNTVTKPPYYDSPAELAGPNAPAGSGNFGKTPGGVSAHVPTVYHEADGQPVVRELP